MNTAQPARASAAPTFALTLRTPVLITLGRLVAIITVPVAIMWAALEWHASAPHAGTVSDAEFSRGIGELKTDLRLLQERTDQVRDQVRDLVIEIRGGLANGKEAQATDGRAAVLRGGQPGPLGTGGTAPAGPVRN